MKAFRAQQFRKPLIEENVPNPLPVEKEVVIDVHTCGLCHSDLHFAEGHINLGGGAELPLQAVGASLPLTFGHEIYGVISDFAPASGLSQADRGRQVIVYPWIGCGECDACRSGRDNACLIPENLGLQRPGGFGEKVVVRDPKFLVDAHDIDPSVGGMFACAGLTAYSALRKVPNPAGWTAIIGMGGVGLMALAVAKGIGFEKVAAIDLNEERLQIASSEYRADITINSRNPEASKNILVATGGVNAVIDFVGSEETSSLALSVLVAGGQYINAGLFGGELRVSLGVLTLKQLTISGSFVGTLNELQELIEYVRAGKIKTPPISTFPIDHLNKSLAALREGRVQGRQVLIHRRGL